MKHLLVASWKDNMSQNKKKPHRKHKIVFPDLGQILSFLTAETIMTPQARFLYCQPHQNASDARKLLEDKRFSGAPLEEDPIRRYVKLGKLQECDERIKYCIEVATEISEHEKVLEKIPIETLITVFAERGCSELLFVTDDKSIVGLVTAADLDKIPVKVYFFIIISALESLLLDVIGEEYENYKCCLQNPEKVEKRYKKQKGELVGLDEHNYLMTPEILEIVWKSEIKTIMGANTWEELEELQFFRNLIAHGNYIITKDEDIGRLKKMDERIRKYMEALERHLKHQGTLDR
jgi:CBS domain-containing protein